MERESEEEGRLNPIEGEVQGEEEITFLRLLLKAPIDPGENTDVSFLPPPLCWK